MLKENRGFIKYLLLCLITLGIYNLYIVHQMAKEANLADPTPGAKNVGGLLFFIIFSILTLGIYDLYWYYKVNEKFAASVRAVNKKPRLTGGGWLLWTLIGSLIIIGPLVAFVKMIHNWNDSNASYNARHR